MVCSTNFLTLSVKQRRTINKINWFGPTDPGKYQTSPPTNEEVTKTRTLVHTGREQHTTLLSTSREKLLKAYLSEFFRKTHYEFC